jgi:hypothetical protein
MKPPKTQAQLDDERIQRQHRKALFRGRTSGEPTRSHLAYKVFEREKTKSEILDDLENMD